MVNLFCWCSIAYQTVKISCWIQCAQIYLVVICLPEIFSSFRYTDTTNKGKEYAVCFILQCLKALLVQFSCHLSLVPENSIVACLPVSYMAHLCALCFQLGMLHISQQHTGAQLLVKSSENTRKLISSLYTKFSLLPCRANLQF